MIKLKDMIDETIVIDLPHEYTNKEKSRILKTNMRNYVKGDFLFIESDGVVSDKSLYEIIKKSVEGKNLKKILILPPDYTRMYSGAGKITNMYYNLLKEECVVDIMPALGTHRPVTKEENELFSSYSIILCNNALM